MKASSFNECNYTYKRGRNKGCQCCNPTDNIFCHLCINRMKEVNSIIIIKEHINAENIFMYKSCLKTLDYSLDDILEIKKYLFLNSNISIYNSAPCIKYIEFMKYTDQYLINKLYSSFILINHLDIYNKDVIGVIKYLYCDVHQYLF